jgi:hypothetical protein
VERIELSANLNLERVDPVATASGAVSERTSRESEPGKARRRQPSPGEEAAEEPGGEEGELPEHRIDSLA